mgnify:CR=1 FL=1
MADFPCRCETVTQTKCLSLLPEKIWRFTTAANIAMAVDNFKTVVMHSIGGIILNRRDVPREEEKVAELADDFHTKVIGTLSHSEQVALAEEQGMTLMECYPESAMAEEYRTIARKMYILCGGVLQEET